MSQRPSPLLCFVFLSGGCASGLEAPGGSGLGGCNSLGSGLRDRAQEMLFLIWISCLHLKTKSFHTHPICWLLLQNQKALPSGPLRSPECDGWS